VACFIVAYSKQTTEGGTQLCKNNAPDLGNAMPVLGMKPKRGLYVLWSFFNIDLCSATSIESSRRDLLNDMAEHRPILKNNQNTHYSLILLDRRMFSHIK